MKWQNDISRKDAKTPTNTLRLCASTQDSKQNYFFFLGLGAVLLKALFLEVVLRISRFSSSRKRRSPNSNISYNSLIALNHKSQNHI